MSTTFSYPSLPPSLPPSLLSLGAKLLKDVSSQEGQDVGAVSDVDGYALTLVDIEQFNAQLA